MRRLAIAIGLAVTKIAMAGPAAGEAGEIFQRGRELAKQGKFAEACALFARSYEIDPAPGTGVNLADCLERQGELRRAWELFDAVARTSQSVQSRARLARERADALVPRLATVVVTLREPAAAGLAIRLGDRALAPAPQIRALVDARDVELVATLPGRPAFRATLHPVAGATAAVEVAFTVEPVATATRRRRSRVYLADAVAGVGVIGLGVAAGFALSARRTYDDAFRHGCTRAAGGPECGAGAEGSEGARLIRLAGKRADIATGLSIAGAVLAAAGAALYFTAPREAVQVAPIASSHELGLGIVGRF